MNNGECISKNNNEPNESDIKKQLAKYRRKGKIL